MKIGIEILKFAKNYKVRHEQTTYGELWTIQVKCTDGKYCDIENGYGKRDLYNTLFSFIYKDAERAGDKELLEKLVELYNKHYV